MRPCRRLPDDSEAVAARIASLCKPARSASVVVAPADTSLASLAPCSTASTSTSTSSSSSSSASYDVFVAVDDRAGAYVTYWRPPALVFAATGAVLLPRDADAAVALALVLSGDDVSAPLRPRSSAFYGGCQSPPAHAEVSASAVRARLPPGARLHVMAPACAGTASAGDVVVFVPREQCPRPGHVSVASVDDDDEGNSGDHSWEGAMEGRRRMLAAGRLPRECVATWPQMRRWRRRPVDDDSSAEDAVDGGDEEEEDEDDDGYGDDGDQSDDQGDAEEQYERMAEALRARAPHAVGGALEEVRCGGVPGEEDNPLWTTENYEEHGDDGIEAVVLHSDSGAELRVPVFHFSDGGDWDVPTHVFLYAAPAPMGGWRVACYVPYAGNDISVMRGSNGFSLDGFYKEVCDGIREHDGETIEDEEATRAALLELSRVLRPAPAVPRLSVLSARAVAVSGALPVPGRDVPESAFAELLPCLLEARSQRLVRRQLQDDMEHVDVPPALEVKPETELALACAREKRVVKGPLAKLAVGLRDLSSAACLHPSSIPSGYEVYYRHAGDTGPFKAWSVALRNDLHEPFQMRW
eukprot:m51a1_g6927 hypothetical protein (582) ;mRNA; f:176819-178564